MKRSEILADLVHLADRACVDPLDYYEELAVLFQCSYVEVREELCGLLGRTSDGKAEDEAHD